MQPSKQTCLLSSLFSLASCWVSAQAQQCSIPLQIAATPGTLARAAVSVAAADNPYLVINPCPSSKPSFSQSHHERSISGQSPTSGWVVVAVTSHSAGRLKKFSSMSGSASCFVYAKALRFAWTKFLATGLAALVVAIARPKSNRTFTEVFMMVRIICYKKHERPYIWCNCY